LRTRCLQSSNSWQRQYGLQDFLAGYVDGGFQYFGDSTRHTYENNFGFYAQDSFRLTPHVTLNYGLRWDYFGVVQEKNNLLSNITNLDPVNDTFTLTQVGQPGLNSLYNPDKKDFAPRVSLAWDVAGKERPWSAQASACSTTLSRRTW